MNEHHSSSAELSFGRSLCGTAGCGRTRSGHRLLLPLQRGRRTRCHRLQQIRRRQRNCLWRSNNFLFLFFLFFFFLFCFFYCDLFRAFFCVISFHYSICFPSSPPFFHLPFFSFVFFFLFFFLVRQKREHTSNFLGSSVPKSITCVQSLASFPRLQAPKTCKWSILRSVSCLVRM